MTIGGGVRRVRHAGAAWVEIRASPARGVHLWWVWKRPQHRSSPSSLHVGGDVTRRKQHAAKKVPFIPSAAAPPDPPGSPSGPESNSRAPPTPPARPPSRRG